MSEQNTEQTRRHAEFIAALNELQQSYGVYMKLAIQHRMVSDTFMQAEAVLQYQITAQPPIEYQLMHAVEVDEADVPAHVIEAERNGRGEG